MLCSWCLVDGMTSQWRSVGTSPSHCSEGHGHGRLTHQSKPIQTKPCLSWCLSQHAGAGLRMREYEHKEKGLLRALAQHLHIWI